MDAPDRRSSLTKASCTAGSVHTWLPDEYLSAEWAMLRPEDTGLPSVIQVYAAIEPTTGVKGARPDLPMEADGSAWSSVEFGDQEMYLRGFTKEELMQYVACVAAAEDLHAGHLLYMGMLDADPEDDLFVGEDRLWQVVQKALPEWRRHVGLTIEESREAIKLLKSRDLITDFYFGGRLPIYVAATEKCEELLAEKLNRLAPLTRVATKH